KELSRTTVIALGAAPARPTPSVAQATAPPVTVRKSRRVVMLSSGSGAAAPGHFGDRRRCGEGLSRRVAMVPPGPVLGTLALGALLAHTYGGCVLGYHAPHGNAPGGTGGDRDRRRPRDRQGLLPGASARGGARRRSGDRRQGGRGDERAGVGRGGGDA